ncbi:probable RNA-binding protein EIF1AD [Neodiprion pinetum]|uniref:Probable RNA-binding protein EIF1AD n=1 Tax=Neodiprion lecontei TaxID=441921 RepID=A0A6J0BPZ8_NEOLC|nr:probable RNA-binding protein EIF1AD [Neodiprion lecontei]XP_046435991.1 probable RNA-binding protein EIF1AD [Neodiprion fabricii]XP_046480161.1 probable RNA-binding protein EIF1AD [Neodiprion pinetum]XP_046612050.1 probable RNA-binding protein EIF1AD [Neodiprion virginianus]
MSKATKRKHVVKEIREDLNIPTESQSIVRIVASKGNNLHEASSPGGGNYLVSMPTKYRKNIWIKRGDYVLVEPIPEGDKVKAEIVKILTKEHIKFYRLRNCWPQEFEKGSKRVERDEDEDLFINTNRRPENHDTTETESDTSSEASDSD